MLDNLKPFPDGDTFHIVKCPSCSKELGIFENDLAAEKSYNRHITSGECKPRSYIERNYQEGLGENLFEMDWNQFDAFGFKHAHI